MGRGSQSPHMHVDFVGQDLKKGGAPRMTGPSRWRGGRYA
jgi:hypothetical protein